MIAACRPPSSTPGKVSWSQRGGMRAASSTNEIARMLGPASHMCHSANQRLGMLGQASHTHVAASQPGGEGRGADCLTQGMRNHPIWETRSQ